MAAENILTFVFLSLGVLGLSDADKYQPCPGLDNACIGQYLATYSSCSVDALPFIDQRTLDPYTLEHFAYYAPFFNLTVDSYDVTVEGVSRAYVKDFYYDTQTKQVVLVIFLPSFSFKGITTLHLLQTGEGRTIDATTDYQTYFKDITLTTVFTDYRNLELSNSFTFFNIPTPATYYSGQGLADAAAADPRVAALANAINKDPNVVTSEAFVYRAPAVVRLFADYKLCFYGV